MAQRTSGGAYDFARFERAQAAPQRVPARPQKTPEGLPKYPSREKTRSSASAKISTPCAER